jgi:hypothetical protein
MVVKEESPGLNLRKFGFRIWAYRIVEVHVPTWLLKIFWNFFFNGVSLCNSSGVIHPLTYFGYSHIDSFKNIYLAVGMFRFYDTCWDCNRGWDDHRPYH